jgi:hypothetical protein
MRRPVDPERLRAFMRELGRSATDEGRVYLTGGATALLLGWREATIDVDLKLEPESDSVLRAMVALKEKLQINVELAAPDQFIPEIPGWRERSPFIAREGRLDFHHYELHAQALAKIERGHAHDLDDVRSMLAAGLVTKAELLRRFVEIEPLLFRFPAIDAASFRRAVEAVTVEIE